LQVGRGDEAAARLGEKAKAESDENEGSALSAESVDVDVDAVTSDMIVSGFLRTISRGSGNLWQRLGR
jgi:hypothetical protein